MSPSNEFMQTVVRLSEDKKMHFHFKMNTLEVLSRQEQAKAEYGRRLRGLNKHRPVAHPRGRPKPCGLDQVSTFREVPGKPWAAPGRAGPVPGGPQPLPLRTAVSRRGDPAVAPAKPGASPPRYFYFPKSKRLPAARPKGATGGLPVRGPTDGSLPSARPLGLPRLQGTPPLPRRSDSHLPPAPGRRPDTPSSSPQNQPPRVQNPSTKHPLRAARRQRFPLPIPASGKASPRARRAKQPSPLPAAARIAARRGSSPPARSPAEPPAPPRHPPPHTVPRSFAACRPPAHRDGLAPAAAPPARALPPPPCPDGAGSVHTHTPPLPSSASRSKTTVTKGWSPPGGGHRQPAGDTGRSQPCCQQPPPLRCPRRLTPSATHRGLIS
ncbi:PREDICTED: basic salivary proline-rich protein 1-like [Calidris pugnax]|uniref:basic salivary proline-rich protein 1-like n=1 Tax=Calidris pugnax TaxID=198806 RepID=UPI00071D4531|nr:PREDICTED: basic salivary proline-rich protein 1-like [Calidris pugnax]